MTDDIVVAEKATTARSRQPRTRQDYDQLVGPGGIMVDILTFARVADTLPAWGNSYRDTRLRKIAKEEPLLAGVLASAVSMAANRDWSITPVDYSDPVAKRQAKEYTGILQNSWVHPSLQGFSGSGRLVAAGAADYYNTDTGLVFELSRTSRARDGGFTGPVRGMYYMDAARVTLSGDVNHPLTYWPTDPGDESAIVQIPGKPLPMFIHVPDLIDGDERKYGLGFCAVSRAALLAQTITALWEHDQQKLSNLPPIGAWLLGPLRQEQYDESIAKYEHDRKNKDMSVYPGLLVIASEEGPITSYLEEFSRLPEHFDRDAVIDIYVNGLALIFGMDSREIWPGVGSGATKADATIQHRKSLQKGLETFLLALQLQINTIIPESVVFKFDERDDAQDELRARISRIRAERRHIDLKSGVISRAEARELALREGDITLAMYESGVPEIEVLPGGNGAGPGSALAGGPDSRTAGRVGANEGLPGSFEQREEV